MKTLIRNGTLVTMDPEIGDLAGDVLIEADRIAAVADIVFEQLRLIRPIEHSRRRSRG